MCSKTGNVRLVMWSIFSHQSSSTTPQSKLSRSSPKHFMAGPVSVSILTGPMHTQSTGYD